MSSDTSGQTITVKTEGATAAATGSAAGEEVRKCPVSVPHRYGEGVEQDWKKSCQERFWRRERLLFLGGITVTAGLIYSGILKSSKRFGPFPKLAAGGILGYAVGKASYVVTSRNKPQELDMKDRPACGPPWSRGGPFATRHTVCNHVCEDCKKKAQASPTEA